MPTKTNTMPLKTRRFTAARVVARPGDRLKGLILIGPHVIPCALGRTGITRFKREGDGGTPAARMALLHGYFRADRIARPAPHHCLAPTPADLGWSDDVGDGRYNRPVTRPFRGSHEEMTRADVLYDTVIVLDWNVTRRALHRGSAIFLHLARPGYTPTEGCIALSRRDLTMLLRMARRGTRIVVRP